MKKDKTLLDHYVKSENRMHIEPFFKVDSSAKKDKSLQELYYELYKKSINSIMNTYNGKNASEIESIMVSNRKQIEESKSNTKTQAS